MRKRALGSTGIEVSELALGTWGLCGDGYGPVEEAEQDAVIDRAVAFGVTLFETADGYANGEMERRLGRRLPKDRDIVIATKIGTNLTASPARKQFDAAYLKEAAERSRERLARDRIDILLLHNPSPPTLERGEAQRALAELVEAGVARTWGVSVGSPEAAAAALPSNPPVLELAYNAFYVRALERITGDVKEKKIGILARSVLSYGLLCGAWPTSKEFPSTDHRSERWTQDELRRRIVQLNALRPSVIGNITSLRAVALRYVLSNDIVTSAVLGPRKGQQLDQLVREAGKEGDYLPMAARGLLEQRLRAIGVKT